MMVMLVGFLVVLVVAGGLGGGLGLLLAHIHDRFGKRWARVGWVLAILIIIPSIYFTAKLSSNWVVHLMYPSQFK